MPKGEFLTMLGPLGIGQDHLPDDAGRIRDRHPWEDPLDGVSINNIPPHKRGIGMVFQNYALFPAYDGGGKPQLSRSKCARSASPTARRRSSARSTWCRWAPLAGGVRRSFRVGSSSGSRLARALVFEPELVLMDEPLGALDKQLREHMQFEITNLAHNLGITTVYVTHDQTEALTMSDRVAVFDDGRIQQIAPPMSSMRARKQLRGAVHR
jgi:putative spermidine/putrescine transport system ATP-binding protein